MRIPQIGPVGWFFFSFLFPAFLVGVVSFLPLSLSNRLV